MKKILLLGVILFLIVPTISIAQASVEFTYDDSGNRISRTVISLKSATTNGLEAKEPIEAQIGLQEARIYPNPTEGLLRIDLPNLEIANASLYVYDLHGKLLSHQTATAFNNEINLFSYPDGVYLLIVQIEQNKREWKIIKQ